MSRVTRVKNATPFLVFVAAVLVLWLLFGNRLILNTNDEGIYLDAAERILHGQKPYVDFFGYMSPGSFWTQALAFRLFGVTMAAARLPVILYIALECGLVYWLVERFASRTAALLTSLFFLAFETADPSMITAQHRWDSSALSLASVALCVGAQSELRRAWLVASGMLVALATLATPSVALLAFATLVWLLSPSGHRLRAGWYLLGFLIIGAVAAAGLWLNGILPALLNQLSWLSRNYSGVNAMPYGSIIGGYRSLFEGAGAWEMPVRFCVVFCVALPAVLPVIALVGGSVFWAQRKSSKESLRAVIPHLLLSILALAASTYPRADVAHLAYVAALPYAVTGILVYRCVSPPWRAGIGIFIAFWAAVFAAQAQLPGSFERLHTPVGAVQASAMDAAVVKDLLSRVLPNQSLFVYPYKPLLYFLTQARNPTRYSYLAPGMMTGEDARVVLCELEASPPAWVLYMDLNRTEFERVFPAAGRGDPHYPDLESWIQKNYRSTNRPLLDGYELLRHESGQ
ncbi:MAG: glycosyltransferase family 39 protein [Bryobacterales bacterium]|nr:glycosyltransferase family 39 protein [Bryobacterales bacterium]